jgi:hypothetical protein
MVVEQGVQILGQSLQDLIRFYVSYLTFGIDILEGIVIGTSAGIAFVAFLKILHKPIMDQRIIVVSNIIKMVKVISGGISLLQLSVINDTNLMAD